MPSSPEPAATPARLRATVIGAFLEGWRRVLRAPVITAGIVLLTWVVSWPMAAAVHDQVETRLGASLTSDQLARGWDEDWAGEFAVGARGIGTTLTHEILGFGGTLATLDQVLGGRPPRPLVWAIAIYVGLWLFLSGGILDRLARGRAVRTNAFFGACGTFFFRFLRLGVVIGAAYWLAFRWLRPLLFDTIGGHWTAGQAAEPSILIARAVLYLAFAATLGLISLVSDFAHVRIVVEDRRSALAGLAAAGRFARRRVWRVAGLYLLNVAAAVVLARFWLQVAPSALVPDWTALLAGQVYLVARIWARLAFMASEVVFFQGELAHAGYAALPEPLWPDSPAVEALRNLGRR